MQIIETNWPPVRNCAAFSTLGLSSHVLKGPKTYRMELVMLARRGTAFEQSARGLLDRFVRLVLQSHRAPLCGETVALGPYGSGALYITMPQYFETDFASISLSVGTCILAWLFPITDEEADFIGTHGWEKFEAEIARLDPDLLDVRTVSVVKCGSP